jgi:hypothetical protein
VEKFPGERKWDAVIAQFGNDDISMWPFTQIGAAAIARGQAYYGERVGDKAEADLRLVLELRTPLSLPRPRRNVLTVSGRPQ